MHSYVCIFTGSIASICFYIRISSVFISSNTLINIQQKEKVKNALEAEKKSEKTQSTDEISEDKNGTQTTLEEIKSIDNDDQKLKNKLNKTFNCSWLIVSEV